jgi:D-3-phosphoglycerate dehydrogenase
MRILVTDGMSRSAIEQLLSRGHTVTEQYYTTEALGEALQNYDCVIVRSKTKIRAEHIDKATQGDLKLIIRGGVGVDNIDVADAEAMGITVRNTPNASSNAVAELAIGLMFSCARYISIAGHTMREHKWDKKAYSKGFELCGKTLGVIGYGRIGKRIGDIAQAIGMKVIAYQRHPKPEYESDTMRFAPLDELLASADIIALSTPSLGAPIINAENIEKMKKLDTPKMFRELGTTLVEGLVSTGAKHGFNLVASGPPALFYLRIANDDSLLLHQDWVAECVNRGMFITSHHNHFINASLTQEDINRSIEIAEDAFKAVKKLHPELG